MKSREEDKGHAPQLEQVRVPYFCSFCFTAHGRLVFTKNQTSFHARTRAEKNISLSEDAI